MAGYTAPEVFTVVISSATSNGDSLWFPFLIPKKHLPLQPLNQQNLKTMGKGDKRSLRGKLFMSSYGNVRPKKGKKVKVQAPPPVQE
jgi:hypothetical protein